MSATAPTRSVLRYSQFPSISTVLERVEGVRCAPPATEHGHVARDRALEDHLGLPVTGQITDPNGLIVVPVHEPPPRPAPVGPGHPGGEAAPAQLQDAHAPLAADENVVSTVAVQVGDGEHPVFAAVEAGVVAPAAQPAVVGRGVQVGEGRPAQGEDADAPLAADEDAVGAVAVQVTEAQNLVIPGVEAGVVAPVSKPGVVGLGHQAGEPAPATQGQGPDAPGALDDDLVGAVAVQIRYADDVIAGLVPPRPRPVVVLQGGEAGEGVAGAAGQLQDAQAPLAGQEQLVFSVPVVAPGPEPGVVGLYQGGPEGTVVGMRCYKENKLEEAMQLFRRAVTLDNNHVLAHYNLACVLARLVATVGPCEMNDEWFHLFSLLTRSINLDPKRADRARKDSDFDGLRYMLPLRLSIEGQPANSAEMANLFDGITLWGETPGAVTLAEVSAAGPPGALWLDPLRHTGVNVDPIQLHAALIDVGDGVLARFDQRKAPLCVGDVVRPLVEVGGHRHRHTARALAHGSNVGVEDVGRRRLGAE